MKEVCMLLEEDEILILRSQARMIGLLVPDAPEQVDVYVKKVLDATSDASSKTKHEIGKMQRAMRKIQKTLHYTEFKISFEKIQNMMAEEMAKEE